MKIHVKDMYGLQGCEFLFDSNDKNLNFIYGSNGIGKSSVSKAITHVLQNKKYVPILPTNSTAFTLCIDFDTLNIDNSNYFNDTDKSIYEKAICKIYVFNKEYVKNNISIEKSHGGYIEIGIRTEERKQLIFAKNLLINDIKGTMVKNIDDFFPQKMRVGDFVSGSLISKFKGNKHEEAILGTEQLLNTTSDITNASVDPGDYIGENSINIQRIVDILDKISDDLLKELKDSLSNIKYDVNTTHGEKFYLSALEYLKTSDKKIICPICKEIEINTEDVIKAINESLEKVTKSKLVKDLKAQIDKLSYKSKIVDQILEIYDELTKNQTYQEQKIDDLKARIKYLSENYDSLLFSLINKNTIDSKAIEEIKKINKTVDTINNENQKIQTHDFVQTLNQNIEKIFGSKLLEAKIDIELGETKLRIDYGLTKGSVSIDKFVTEILSESERTKLSLALYLSVIMYKNKDNSTKEKILCIFDDPFDSYDSMSRYEINRVIYEFLTNKSIYKNNESKIEIFSIIFSHSYDYLRLYKNCFHFNPNDFYIFSRTGLQKLQDTDLYLLSGDLNILRETVISQKTSSILEFFALMPILRDLSRNAQRILRKETEKLKIDGKVVENLYKNLTEYIIKGYGNNKTIDELTDLVSEYSEISIEPTVSYNSSEKIFAFMKNYLDNELSSSVTYDFKNELIVKNIYALFIRAFYEYEATNIMLNEMSLPASDLENYMTTGRKFFKISQDPSLNIKYQKLINDFSSTKIKYNDFAHSMDFYISPLIDVSLPDIKEEYRNLPVPSAAGKPKGE